MVRQKIVFRADGSNQMGLGHISRCLALAELLSDNFDISFATRDTHPGLRELIGKTTDDIILLPEDQTHQGDSLNELSAHIKGHEIVVLDGYHFTTQYERNLKRLAGAVVSIDDIPSRDFVADVIINFCGTMNSGNYSREFYTQVFTGLDYLFLRSPFLRTSPSKKLNDRLFVNMGGTDAKNNTAKILTRVLSSGYDGTIDIVVGKQYQFLDVQQPIIQKSMNCTVHCGLSAEEIHRVMYTCSRAIVPPSTVALEFLSTGGLAFLHQTADNQTLLKRYLQDTNLASDFHDFANVFSAKDLLSFFERRLDLQKKAFSGDSLMRVQKIFANLALSSQLRLRKATANDIEISFEWANESEARKHSYSRENIPWEQHVLWFQKKINDAKCVYFIASIGPADVGQIRFDLTDPSVYQISYSLDKVWRGKGLGLSLLLKAIQEFRNQASSEKIVGFVQKTNVASIKAFERASFKMYPTNKYPDSLLFQLP